MEAVSKMVELAPAQEFLGGKVVLRPGDCRDVLKSMADASVDSVVTDPPYALVSIGKRFGKDGSKPVVVPEGGSGAYARASAGFMNAKWDVGDTAFATTFWAEVFRVLKPGGHVVAFSGTRTYHRLACAIEDAGFEIRDQLAWMYGSGFPKSHDVSKGIDKAAGAEREVVDSYARQGRSGGILGQPTEIVRDITAPATDAARQWQGWGTALKPAWEPICLARKPLIGTVAANVRQHGTGAINVDGCRVGDEVRYNPAAGNQRDGVAQNANILSGTDPNAEGRTATGRWPANIIHDGSDEVLAAFPSEAGGGIRQGGTEKPGLESGWRFERATGGYLDSGSAARFFYTAKADKGDRMGSKHPTVKPVDLMQWLCRLVTPPGGIVLDPFAGSGSTGEAAWREGFRAVLVEREVEYQADIAERLRLADKGPTERRARAIKQVADAGPLFGANDNESIGGGQTDLRQVRGPATGLQGRAE